jgi:hypothetical protein
MTSLITLPIRLPLEITWRAAKLGVGVVRAVAGLLDHDEPERTAWPVMEDEPRDVAPEAVVVVDDEPPPAPEPRHVDSEPTLSYEAGPAEDPGATIHVNAPWDGYDRMRAADIVDRLRVADEATRAVVRLYEQQGKARSSVLAATG